MAYRVEWMPGGVVRLPPFRSIDEGIEVFISPSDWRVHDDSGDPLDEAMRVWLDSEANRAQARTNPGLEIELSLIPRPDNDHTGYAVSVAVPSRSPRPPSSWDGEDVDRRHLGYLYNSFLMELGTAYLHNLARYSSDAEIRCVGYFSLEVEAGISLALPDPAALRIAVNTFFDSPDTPRLAMLPQLPFIVALERWGLEQAEEYLLVMSESEAAPVSPKAVVPRTISVDQRWIEVIDPETKSTIGEVRNGLLLNLRDERDRGRVRELLEELRIDTKPPLAVVRTGDIAWSTEDVPANVWLVDREHSQELKVRGLDRFAYRRPSTGEVWVEHAALASSACAYFARVGLEVTQVHLPRRPWRVDNDVPIRQRADLRAAVRLDLGDLTLRLGPRSAEARYEDCRPKLWDSAVNQTFPVDVLSADMFEWLAVPLDGVAPPDSPAYERHLFNRAVLFPGWSPTGENQRCRLCGRWTVEFEAGISSAALAYCERCLALACRGMQVERSAAVEAISQVGRAEFDNVPMLQDQFDTIHANPTAPISPSAVDRGMLLRFAVPRGKWSWTQLLIDSGLAPRGIRSGRGTIIRARDGHLCLSLRERAVCDFLHVHQLSHTREPRYPRDEQLNPRGLRRADWRLSDGTFVELWGMASDPPYAAKMIEKRLLAERHGLRLLEIDETTLPDLAELFKKWIDPAIVAAIGWSWSPAVSGVDPPT
jgi:hypothetical protein